jgi:hypothetical protein
MIENKQQLDVNWKTAGCELEKSSDKQQQNCRVRYWIRNQQMIEKNGRR